MDDDVYDFLVAYCEEWSRKYDRRAFLTCPSSDENETEEGAKIE